MAMMMEFFDPENQPKASKVKLIVNEKNRSLFFPEFFLAFGFLRLRLHFLGRLLVLLVLAREDLLQGQVFQLQDLDGLLHLRVLGLQLRVGGRNLGQDAHQSRVAGLLFLRLKRVGMGLEPETFLNKRVQLLKPPSPMFEY